jgi:glycerol-3-phosphate O-acyltransferase / dihydroxyacetone phosphate acyltransferase
MHYTALSCLHLTTCHKSQQDKVRFRGKSEQLVVRTIVSDTELELADACDADTCALGESQWDKLTYVDQSTVFDDVYDALSQGRNLGIFPEGGSHDRTDLLPLKVSCFKQF